MMGPIKPALSDGQWEWHDRSVSLHWDALPKGHPDMRANIWLKLDEDGRLSLGNSEADGFYEIREIAPEARHGAAALCLYGQPFGFTREDVRASEIVYRALIERPEPLGEELAAALEVHHRTAAKLAALLPPETP